MDSDNVAARLKFFIDKQGISFSQFADRCGIPRPSFSQMMSGRNKKVSNIMLGQIHEGFPSLSLNWLLFGEGEPFTQMTDGAGDQAGAETAAADGINYTPSDDPEGNGPQSSSPEGCGRSEVRDEPYVPYGIAPDMEDEWQRRHIELVRQMDAERERRLKELERSMRMGNCQAGSAEAKETGLNSPGTGSEVFDNKEFELQMRIAALESELENLRQNPRRVTKITIFYDDFTFQSFSPDPTETQ